MTRPTYSKLYKGNVPTDGCVHLLAMIFGAERWDLYVRELDGAGDWLKLKLVAAQPVAAKANYWLEWSLTQSRFASGRYFQSLQRYRSVLAAELEMYLAAVIEDVGDPRRLPQDTEPGIHRRPALLPPAPPATIVQGVAQGVTGVSPKKHCESIQSFTLPPAPPAPPRTTSVVGVQEGGRGREIAPAPTFGEDNVEDLL